MPYLYIMILGLRFGKIFIVGLHRVVAVSVILVVVSFVSFQLALVHFIGNIIFISFHHFSYTTIFYFH